MGARYERQILNARMLGGIGISFFPMVSVSVRDSGCSDNAV